MERAKRTYGIFLFFQVNKQIKLIDRARIIKEIKELERIFSYHGKVKVKAYNTYLTNQDIKFFLYLEVTSLIFYEELAADLQKNFFSLYLNLIYTYNAIKNPLSIEEKFAATIPELQSNNPDIQKKYGFLLPFSLKNSWFTLAEKEQDQIIKEMIIKLAPFSKVMDRMSFQATGLSNLVDGLAFLQSNSIFRFQELMSQAKSTQLWSFLASYQIFWGIEESVPAILSSWLRL